MAVPFPASPDLQGDDSTYPEQPPSKGNRFYQTHSGAAFSRSAAKRQSVMALPSIKHLQHQYVKLGLSAAPSAPAVPSRSTSDPLSQELESSTSAEPSASRPSALRLASGAQFSSLRDGDLPPSPAKPKMDRRMPWEREGATRSVKAEKDLRREVQEALQALSNIWQLDASAEPDSAQASIVDILQISTSAVRSVQSWAVALPSHRFPPSQLSTSSRPPLVPTTASLLHPGIETPHRASSSNIPSPATCVDPLQQLRKASLDLLGALRDIEGRFRLSPLVPPLAGEQQDGQAEEEPARSPSVLGSEPSSASITGGQLVEYQEGVGLHELEKEKLLVRRVIEVVEGLLEQSTMTGVNKAETGGRRAVSEQLPTVSGRSQEEVAVVGSIEEYNVTDVQSHDDSLPLWAQPDAFAGEKASLDRAHSLLSASLPSSLTSRLLPPSPPSSPQAFLLSLSDGQLLCLAFNAIVRASVRPFGFIPEKDVHDLSPPSAETVKGAEMERSKSESERKRVGETFRKVENVRVWAAAIKLRYLVNLDPPKPSSAPSSFNPLLIARRDEGWIEMLQEVLEKWVEKVVQEKREESRVEAESRG